MSYDVALYDSKGTEVVSLNHTSNTAPMWRAAGCDLADLDGLAAGDVLPQLDTAIAQLRAQPATYRAMEPSNRWGTYQSCLDFLVDLRVAFAALPHLTVVVSA